MSATLKTLGCKHLAKWHCKTFDTPSPSKKDMASESAADQEASKRWVKDIKGYFDEAVYLITLGIMQANCHERLQLQLARSILTRCDCRVMPVGEEQVRLKEQLQHEILWIKEYLSYQNRCTGYRVSLADSLLPVTEELDTLMLSFAADIVEGASALAYMLGVQKPNPWVLVKREQRIAVPDEKTQPPQEEPVMIECESDEETGDCIGTYGYGQW